MLYFFVLKCLESLLMSVWGMREGRVGHLSRCGNLYFSACGCVGCQNFSRISQNPRMQPVTVRWIWWIQRLQLLQHFSVKLAILVVSHQIDRFQVALVSRPRCVTYLPVWSLSAITLTKKLSISRSVFASSVCALVPSSYIKSLILLLTLALDLT